MNLTGKVAIVTGAGRGIGKAVAEAYARAGADLALIARTAEEVTATDEAVRRLGRRCLRYSGDVSQEDQVADFVKEVLGEFGRIDVLVNNAGVMTRPTDVVDFDVKKWDYTIAVNLRGPFLCTKMVLPTMLSQKSGSIINVTSMMGRGAYPRFAAYGVSKWGIEGFTRILAEEVESVRIRVNAVDPGYVATKLTRYAGSSPESVTEVFVFLASDDSRKITGRTLTAEGWKKEIREG